MILNVPIVVKMLLRDVQDARISGIVVEIARLNHGRDINHYVILYSVIKKKIRREKKMRMMVRLKRTNQSRVISRRRKY
jgi:ribosome-binding factor A